MVLAAKRPEKASLRPFTTGDGLGTAGPKTELFCCRGRQIQWFRAESGRVMVGDCRIRFCSLAVCVWTLLFSDGQILAENSGIKITSPSKSPCKLASNRTWINGRLPALSSMSLSTPPTHELLEHPTVIRWAETQVILALAPRPPSPCITREKPRCCFRRSGSGEIIPAEECPGRRWKRSRICDPLWRGYLEYI